MGNFDVFPNLRDDSSATSEATWGMSSIISVVPYWYNILQIYICTSLSYLKVVTNCTSYFFNSLPSKAMYIIVLPITRLYRFCYDCIFFMYLLPLKIHRSSLTCNQMKPVTSLSLVQSLIAVFTIIIHCNRGYISLKVYRSSIIAILEITPVTQD